MQTHTKVVEDVEQGEVGRKTDEVAERRGESYDQFGSQHMHTASQMMCPLLNIYRTPSKDMCAEVQGLLSAEANKLRNVEQQSVAGNRRQCVCLLLVEIRMRKI